MRKNEFNNRANIVRLDSVRVAPRKLRVLVDMVRSQPVEEALTVLRYSERQAATPLIKLIESGVANVQSNLQDWNVDDLYIASAAVDEGPTMRRFRPRAQGRASRIRKRTSRVMIELRPLADVDGDAGVETE